MKEIKTFINNIKLDYKSNNISKKEKRICYYRMIGLSLKSMGSAITAPLIYPIWYTFRKNITERIYKGTSWQEISTLIQKNDTELVKSKLKSNSRLLYWIWTYGDCDDPLGTGGMLESFGKNTFWNRFKWGALRNPRFNINYLEYRTQTITDVKTIIDTRNFNYRHYSQGLGPNNIDGIYFKWMKDVNNKWYFIYEDNNANHIFYCGYVGLLYNDVGYTGGRFEKSYRKTNSSRYVDV